MFGKHDQKSDEDGMKYELGNPENSEAKIGTEVKFLIISSNTICSSYSNNIQNKEWQLQNKCRLFLGSHRVWFWQFGRECSLYVFSWLPS